MDWTEPWTETHMHKCLTALPRVSQKGQPIQLLYDGSKGDGCIFCLIRGKFDSF